MTNTKLLEKVTVITGTRENEGRQAMLEDLLTEIRNEIATEINKKAGKGSQSKIIKKILKSNVKNGVRKQFFTTYILDGKQYVADLYRIFSFTDPSTDVETKEWEPGDLDFRKLMPDNYTGELNVPDLGKLKAYFKEQKAVLKSKGEKPNVYFCMDGKVLVDIEYLIDTLEAIPGVKLYYVGRNHIPTIIGGDEKGNRCFILPINPVGSSGRRMTEEQKMKEAKTKFQEHLDRQAKYGL